MHILQVAEILGASSEQGSVSFLMFVSRNIPLGLRKGPFLGEREVGVSLLSTYSPKESSQPTSPIHN